MVYLLVNFELVYITGVLLIGNNYSQLPVACVVALLELVLTSDVPHVLLFAGQFYAFEQIIRNARFAPANLLHGVKLDQFKYKPLKNSLCHQ